MNSDDQAFIEGVRARCYATSPGLWLDKVTDNGGLVVQVPNPHGGEASHIYMGDMEDTDHWDHADAAFIANAHQDIPRLLAIISRLSAENSKLRKIGLAYISKLGQEMELELDSPTRTTQAQEQGHEQ